MPSRYEQYTTHHTSRRTDGWDYTQPAAYFVTICTEGRRCLFGAVERGRMFVNALGTIVAEEWHRSETIRDRVHLDAFVVMPNHLHGIVVFADPSVAAPTCPRGYRAFRAWTGAPTDASEDDAAGPDAPADSPTSSDRDPSSTGGVDESTSPPSDKTASAGGVDESTSPPSDKTASAGGVDESTPPPSDKTASTGGVDESTSPPSDKPASTGGSTLMDKKSDARGDSDAPDAPDPAGESRDDRPTGPDPKSLGAFVAGFKSAATTRINAHRGTAGAPVWQRNYHDRIIRTERHWRAARRYIRRNPADWHNDRFRGDG